MPDLLGYLLYIVGDDRRERGKTGDDGEWNLEVLHDLRVLCRTWP